MNKLTITFDNFDMNFEKEKIEFQNYLLSLKGIIDTDILQDTKNGLITFNITYNALIISNKILLLEVETLLNVLSIPSLIFFDKHFEGKLEKKEIKKEICCEYCFKIAIEDLYEIDGIEKVDTNYIERYIDNDNRPDNDSLTVYYDSSKYDFNKIDKIISDLNI